MIGQKSITSFFSPLSKKRNLDEILTCPGDARDYVSKLCFILARLDMPTHFAGIVDESGCVLFIC